MAWHLDIEDDRSLKEEETDQSETEMMRKSGRSKRERESKATYHKNLREGSALTRIKSGSGLLLLLLLLNENTCLDETNALRSLTFISL